MSDPLSAAIDAAVQRAVAAQLPKIIEAIKANQPPAPAPPPKDEDRFVRMAEVAHLLGVHRATVHKMEKAGRLPPRRHIGAAAGYLMSEIRSIQQGMVA